MPDSPIFLPTNAPQAPGADIEKLWELLPNTMLKEHWKCRSRLRRLMQKPSAAPGWQREYRRLFEQLKASSKRRQSRLEALPPLTYPQELPITACRAELIEAIQTHQVLIVSGETGSGKTTQIPKMCLEAGQGIAGTIGCTQPRRIAATSTARRIAKELDCELGKTVGYKIRFSEKTSDHTLIQLMTDGILLNEIQHDRFLNQYDTLIVDEAHERSLNIDFILGYLKRLLKKRQDLKLIISSANLDIPRFSQAFGQAPVVEVSGRLYPVEVHYEPMDEQQEEQGEATLCDAVVGHVRSILEATWQGNILVFMPGEQEIREVLHRLESHKQKVATLPLYGRLTNQEQNRIFQNTSQRKVIVATNIAETSLTIPGIRYVIDSGLARISRYSNKSRTQRLPVEPISQSSANQRKGRAGRVEAGICIRLYSEDSYTRRKEFTEPEILRSSLAEVILQMKALRFGEIEQFPFIDPPSSSAIREGVKLLKELGALNETGHLTPLGKEMSRLPIEPRTARMLLAARQENALREVLVIASAISSHDPREYPLEKIEHAKQMHSKFVDKTSDFITLLNIWDRYHEQWESIKSENKMRKFCKQHFLSFIRLREWRDIYRQLSAILSELPDFQLDEEPASYQAIHGSILTGFLHQIGLKKEKNIYQAAGNKEIMIFPGSGIFNKARPWIVAAELVETTRLFARIVANIEVEWLEPIGHNLCRRTYSEPHFDSESNSVAAYEKVTLYGLVIVPKRRVFFGKINPAEATAVFIREALVEGRLRTHHPFFKHNQALKAQVIQTGAKLRRDYELEVEAAMEDFYQQQLFNVASLHDLNGWLKQKKKEKKIRSLFMTLEDLAPRSLNAPSSEAFPDHWAIGEHQLKLEYQFSPENEKDGVTLHLQEKMLPYLEAHALDWLVPGLWEEKILHLLKALPKQLRKKLVPLPPTVRAIVQTLQPTHPKFLDALSAHIHKHYGLAITPLDWDTKRLPNHLKLRVEIRDHQHTLVSAGREIGVLLKDGQKRFYEKNQSHDAAVEFPQWKEAALQWEWKNLTTWSFETLPSRIEIPTSNGAPLYAYPGLKMDEGGIHRCLFRLQEEALHASKKAMRHLLAMNTGAEVAWLDQDLKDLKEFKEAYRPFGNVAQLKAQARTSLHDYLFGVPWIETKAEFEKHLMQAKNKTKGLWPRFKKLLHAILQQHGQTQQDLFKYLAHPALAEHYEALSLNLSELMPPDFVQTIPFLQWNRLPCYLKALSLRAERIAFHPGKDEEKLANLTPYLNQWLHWQQAENLSESQKAAREAFRWMLEEFKISLFAPELKTAMPISAKRLDKFLEKQNSPAFESFERMMLL